MKNYLVIGASSGIGKAIAESLAGDGAMVYGTFKENELPNQTNLVYHDLDVLEDTFDLSFLPEQLDGLVYCPGSINLKPFTRIKPEAFRADFDLQVVGAIKVIQAVLKHLKKGAPSGIVLFSTVAVQTGFAFHSQVSTSKGAIEGLVRALAAELAPQIRVNGIAPSLTDTPLAAKLLSTDEKKAANAQRHPLKQIGTPEDLAAMATFLLSDQAKWMSGQILHVDGGMSTLKV